MVARRKSMQVTVPSTFVQRSFKELTQRVFSGREHFIVQKEGLSVMAILPMAEYDALMKEREELEHIREERNKNFRQIARRIGENVEKLGLTEDEFNDFIEASRQELYDKKQGNHDATE
jgi:hypothetical protein